MRKNIKYLLLSILISLITIGALIYTSGQQGFWNSFRYIKPSYVALAIFLHALGWIFWAIRAKILSNVIGFNLRLKEVFYLILSSEFIASITPSSVGGEAARIYFFKNTNKGTIGSASAVVFGERFLDLIFLFSIGGLSLVFISQELFNVPSIQLIFILLSIIFSLILSTFLLIIFKPKVIKKLVNIILKPFEELKPGLVDGVNKQINLFRRGMITFLNKGKLELLISFSLTICLWSLEFSIPYVIIKGVGIEIQFLKTWASYPLVLAIMMIPLTPGSSGVAEAGFTMVYTALATIPIIGIVVLLWRFSTYFMNLLVGGIVSSVYLKSLRVIDRRIK